MFRASVKPFTHHDEQEGFTADECTARKREAQKILKELKRVMPGEIGTDAIGVEEGAELVCNYQVERGELLTELQEYALEVEDNTPDGVYSGEQQTRFNHLVEIRNSPGYYLPVYFFFPLWVPVKDLRVPVFVGSSMRLAEELEMLDSQLEASQNAKLAKMPDFMRAARDQLEDYESSLGRGDNFWEKFTFALLRRLVVRSVERKMPIVIS